jgi:hypothetical protein
MGQDRDLPVSLPSPPPPRPAARREAIDAALRKFDGIEDAPAPTQPRRRLSWATMHRRPAGALAAAAIVAIIGIPAIQIAIRDNPTPVAEEAPAPDLVAPDQVTPDRSPVAREVAPTASTEEEVADPPLGEPAQRAKPSPDVAADRLGIAPVREERAKTAAPAPARSAPAAPSIMAVPAPPPPPPPPPAEPQAEADTSAYDSIIVTGSRVNRPNLDSASPVTVIDTTNDFLSRLRDALAANNRRAILGLVALPLKVSFDGDVRTYRTRRDIDRDFGRIFSAEVRQSARTLHPHALTTRDGGRLRGNGLLWFGCGKRECTSGEAMKVREVVVDR